MFTPIRIYIAFVQNTSQNSRAEMFWSFSCILSYNIMNILLKGDDNMQILSVESIPKILGLYFNENHVSIDDLHNFKSIFKGELITIFEDNKYVVCFNQRYKVIDFLLEKTKLDRYYNCKYEEDLQIPKSVSNESFDIKLDNNITISVYIYGYDEKLGILILDTTI